jgi:hypothetical protein
MANGGGVLVSTPQPLIPGTCQNLGAWFHYPDGSPAGQWFLGFVGPAAGMNAPENMSYWSLSSYMWPPVIEQIFEIYFPSFGVATQPVSVDTLAGALWQSGSIYSPTGVLVDSYAIQCADSWQDGNCPSGTYYDNESESCQLIIPLEPIPPLNPPPPTPCPTGTVWNPATETCVTQVNPNPPPPPPTCPPGFIWDPYTETCIANPNPPPPPPGPCPPPLSILPCCPTSLGTEGDELTDGITCTNTNLYIIACWAQAELQAMQGGGTQPNGECCASVVAQLQSISQSISLISSAIAPAAGGGSPLIDLTVINTAVTDIAADLDFFREALPISISQLVDAINNNVVPALQALAPTAGVPVPDQPIDASFAAFMQSTLTAWVADGTIDAPDAQTVS